MARSCCGPENAISTRYAGDMGLSSLSSWPWTQNASRLPCAGPPTETAPHWSYGELGPAVLAALTVGPQQTQQSSFCTLKCCSGFAGCGSESSGLCYRRAHHRSIVSCKIRSLWGCARSHLFPYRRPAPVAADCFLINWTSGDPSGISSEKRIL